MNLEQAMKTSHAYVLFNPFTQTIMKAEHAIHTVVPKEVLDQGEEAILAYCNVYEYSGKYSKKLLEQARNS